MAAAAVALLSLSRSILSSKSVDEVGKEVVEEEGVRVEVEVEVEAEEEAAEESVEAVEVGGGKSWRLLVEKDLVRREEVLPDPRVRHWCSCRSAALSFF